MPMCKSVPATVVGLLLAGCAVFSPVQPGMTRDQVQARLGAPTAVVPLPGGEERLQYSGQPLGQTATMVDLDASGHVLRDRQVLTAADFARIQPGWSRADVLREFGRPAKIDGVRSWDGDVWTYRWRADGDMFYWVYFDPAGKVGRTQQGMEYFNAPNGRK